MGQLWYLPLEQLDERYTGMLRDHTLSEFERLNVDSVEVVDGEPLTREVDEGQVLDAESRNYYAMDQIQSLLRELKFGELEDGDVVFNQDFWHMGILSLAYSQALRDIDIGVYGFVCSGSFEEWDFVNQSGMTSWARPLEEAWAEVYDGLFVANRRMRDMVLEVVDDPSKVHVTGLPLSQDWIYERVTPKPPDQREDIVVFPHRWDREKDPKMFNRLADRFSEEPVRFVHTTGRTGEIGNGPEPSENVEVIRNPNGKEEYYELLSRAKVIFSSAYQDTVGNAMFEAINLGCTPVVPESQYDEYVPPKYRYERGDLFEAEELVRHFLEDQEQVPEITARFNYSTERMIEVMDREYGVISKVIANE